MEFFQYGPTELTHLKQQDRSLAQAIDRIGLIERRVIPDLFTALVNCIVGQQISSKAADTVWNRVIEHFQPLTPQTIAAASAEAIQQCGMSMRKAGYIKQLGSAALNGDLDLTHLPQLPDEQVIEQLIKLPGIGVWTAEMILIFSMQRPNVVSWGDLAIRRGLMQLYGLEKLDKTQFDHYKQLYSPYGSVASLYLWHISQGY